MPPGIIGGRKQGLRSIHIDLHERPPGINFSPTDMLDTVPPTDMLDTGPLTDMLDTGPLTDDEIQELDRFLLEAEGLEESMDVSALDGFLTAILSGPKIFVPSEWVRWVWDMERGEDEPKFKDQAQAMHVIGLMMRHMNDIARTLMQAPDQYEPLLLENSNDADSIPVIESWCAGFMQGVQMGGAGWLQILTGKPDWMSTIILYGTGVGREALKKKNLSPEARKSLADGLGDTARRIHALCLAERSRQVAEGTLPGMARREPMRNPNKVGRNDPCPCGSGKKFKQCHGNSARMQ